MSWLIGYLGVWTMLVTLKHHHGLSLFWQILQFWYDSQFICMIIFVSRLGMQILSSFFWGKFTDVSTSGANCCWDFFSMQVARDSNYNYTIVVGDKNIESWSFLLWIASHNHQHSTAGAACLCVTDAVFLAEMWQCLIGQTGWQTLFHVQMRYFLSIYKMLKTRPATTLLLLVL